MSHGIPVPPGNQSPYPLHEPAHAHEAAPVKKTKASVASQPSHTSAGSVAVIGGALAVGALAIAALVFGRREKPVAPAKRKSRAKA